MDARPRSSAKLPFPTRRYLSPGTPFGLASFVSSFPAFRAMVSPRSRNRARSLNGPLQYGTGRFHLGLEDRLAHFGPAVRRPGHGPNLKNSLSSQILKVVGVMNKPLTFVGRQHAIVAWSSPSVVAGQYAGSSALQHRPAFCIDVRPGRLSRSPDHDLVVAVGTVATAVP